MVNSADRPIGSCLREFPRPNFEGLPHPPVPGAYLFTLVPNPESRTPVKWPALPGRTGFHGRFKGGQRGTGIHLPRPTPPDCRREPAR